MRFRIEEKIRKTEVNPRGTPDEKRGKMAGGNY
jgi:hypothetical protein